MRPDSSVVAISWLRPEGAQVDSSLLNFNIQTASGFYSALCGVLAGFCFTAIILLLGDYNRRGEDSKGLEAPLLVLYVTFFALVVCSFLYGVVTGDTDSAARANLLSLLASCIFAVAALAMFLTIGWTLQAYGLRALRRYSQALCHSMLAICVVWIAITVGDSISSAFLYDWKDYGHSWGWITALMGPILVAYVWTYLLRRPVLKDPLRGVAIFTMVDTAVLACVFGGFADFPISRTRHLVPLSIHVLMVAQGVGLAMCVLATKLEVWESRTGQTDSDQSSSHSKVRDPDGASTSKDEPVLPTSVESADEGAQIVIPSANTLT